MPKFAQTLEEAQTLHAKQKNFKGHQILEFAPEHSVAHIQYSGDHKHLKAWWIISDKHEDWSCFLCEDTALNRWTIKQANFPQNLEMLARMNYVLRRIGHPHSVVLTTRGYFLQRESLSLPRGFNWLPLTKPNDLDELAE